MLNCSFAVEFVFTEKKFLIVKTKPNAFAIISL